MKEVKVREFDIAEYDQLAKLWIDSGLGFRLGDDEDSVRVKLTRDPDLFLVAQDGGKLVGSAMGGWDGRRGWIYHLGVLPAYRRKGVARSLVTELERRMREKGVLKVNGLVYTWNRQSKSFFSKMGYRVLVMSEVEKQLNEWNYEMRDPKARGRGSGGKRRGSRPKGSR